MGNKNLLPLSIIVLAISVIFGSIWLGLSIERTVNSQDSNPTSAFTEKKTLTLPQVAQYLNMTEEEVRSIIQTEKKILEETGGFPGKMFPYFSVNDKLYFYQGEIDEWLKEVSSNRRVYNTINGWIL